MSRRNREGSQVERQHRKSDRTAEDRQWDSNYHRGRRDGSRPQNHDDQSKPNRDHRFRERENKSDDNQSSSGSRERLWCDDDEELRLDKDDDGARSTSSSSANNRQQRSNGGERKKDAADTIERDPVVLARRQKQIDYGKNTVSYDNYTDKVPKAKRQPGMPRTPPKHRKFSRRQWDGLIKHWKIRIHEWNVSENGISPEEEVSLKHAGAKRSHELPEPLPAVLTPVQDDVEPPKGRKLSPSDLLRPMD